ncbi:MAG: hypothetical protein HY901_12840 [Deltaproteobacteria bacterium]|nr:hypothetical protein [Deltaproteobacteria bacterium]
MPGDGAADGEGLPEVENRTVAGARTAPDPRGGPLDLGDASKANNLEFADSDAKAEEKKKAGPLQLEDAAEAGSLDFTSMDSDDAEY